MAILRVFVMYVKMLLLTAQMWIKNASVILKTLRSSLNCFLAFSWFSSSGVYNTSVNNLLCIIMLQLDKLFCPKKTANHTHHCWVENFFDVSNKILPRQRSQRLLLVASFFNKCFHFGHQINLFPFATQRIKSVCICQHPTKVNRESKSPPCSFSSPWQHPAWEVPESPSPSRRPPGLAPASPGSWTSSPEEQEVGETLEKGGQPTSMIILGRGGRWAWPGRPTCPWHWLQRTGAPLTWRIRIERGLWNWAGGGWVWYHALGSPLTLRVEVMAEFYVSLNAGGFMMWVHTQQ